MNGDTAAGGGRVVFTRPHFQRIIVLDPAGRWLGLLRSMLAGRGSATGRQNTSTSQSANREEKGSDPKSLRRLRDLASDPGGSRIGSKALQAHDNPARFVVPALDLADAAAMAGRLERSLVLVDVPPARLIQICASVATMNLPRSVMLVASSNDADPRATLLFLESGFAAIIGSVAEADRLLRLAAAHFSGQLPVPRPWPAPVLRQLPWPRHASDVNWAAVLP